MANAIRVAMTMPTTNLRCVASIDVAVEDIDLGIMQSCNDLVVRLSGPCDQLAKILAAPQRYTPAPLN
jgi:hypothetical protein